MSQNRSLSEIFENLDVDYQMLISLGKNEPFYRPRNQFFSHVIGIYFISFFIEHPVPYSRLLTGIPNFKVEIK